MSAFDQLHPSVQHHIVNSLGWRELRPLQEQSIGPVLAGKHCLLIAPTAGGKTESALFPVLSRMLSEQWEGLSVLYLCPLKALLNNLHHRLEALTRLVGRRCEIWHGDVAGHRKDQVRKDPPDLLLTTPESLEGMLVSVNPLGREMLRGVRVVIVDEIHAFAGDDRGWHLLCLLERLVRLSGREIQRLGLSATVGNPGQLLEWFSAHGTGERQVVMPPPAPAASADVQLDFVGSLENAALVISLLHRGEKRLVFCDSRSRVEQLATALRNHGVETYLSHSSLSLDQRRSAEKAFAESRNCVIVATSTLELGIDVGDLDRVIQIDAPATVASFLQRLGRTGRRSGTRRNCLFLATSDRALLRSAALLELWEQGYVEPIRPPAQPLHILAQQLMALGLQLGGLGERTWRDWIGRLPSFASLSDETFHRILDHLLQRGILFREAGLLSMGVEGEASYGRRHFLELLSVFTTTAMLRVFHGLRELGTVESGALIRSTGGAPAVIALAGGSWVVRGIDWRSGQVHVEPTDAKGRGAWIGGGQGLSHALAQAIKRLLLSPDTSARWSNRASAAMARVRGEFGYLHPDALVLVVDRTTALSDWFTFAGSNTNDLLVSHLARTGLLGSADGLGLHFSGASEPAELTRTLGSIQPDEVTRSVTFDDEACEALKFHDCLPPEILQQVLHSRFVDTGQLEGLLKQPTVLVSLSD